MKQPLDHIALQKLRRGVPITQTDLREIENMLIEAGVGDQKTIEQLGTIEEAGLPGFIRSVIGMDRQAAAMALNDALASDKGKPLTATQLDFLERIIDWLAQNGKIDPGILWEAPFDRIHPQGISGVFSDTAIKLILRTLDSFEPKIIRSA